MNPPTDPVLETPGTVLFLAPAPVDPAGCPAWLTGPATDAEEPVAVAGGRVREPRPDGTGDRSPTVTRVDVAREGVLAADGLTLLDRLAVDGTESTAVCVEGLTTIVREQGTEVAFRVLVALQTIARHRPLRIHVHLDPDPVGPRTRRTLAQAVDSVVRYDGDDPIVVRDEAL